MIRICDQIGILPDETPMLILDKQEYNAIRRTEGYSRKIRRNIAGECCRLSRTIYIDGSARFYTYRKYYTKLARKRTGISYRWRTVKATYRERLHCLVHELVHYRFKSLSHGLAFENRTSEIIRGKSFEPHGLS